MEDDKTSEVNDKPGTDQLDTNGNWIRCRSRITRSKYICLISESLFQLPTADMSPRHRLTGSLKTNQTNLMIIRKKQ